MKVGDLHLQLKELDGWYQAEHPDFYSSAATLNCVKCGGVE